MLQSLSDDLLDFGSRLVPELERIARDQRGEGFNAFTLVSGSYRLEHFHSRILHSFLTPAKTHDEGSVFLNAFVQLIIALARQQGKEAVYSMLGNALPCAANDIEVKREWKNIDLCIINRADNWCIVLENKMNWAQDQIRQLPRYMEIAKQEGLEVLAIVYITPTSGKDAPTYEEPSDNERVSPLFIHMQACGETNGLDLATRWLPDCETNCRTIDAQAVARQYRLMLQSCYKQEKTGFIMDQFINNISSPERYAALRALADQHQQLEAALCKRWISQINDQPWAKSSIEDITYCPPDRDGGHRIDIRLKGQDQIALGATPKLGLSDQSMEIAIWNAKWGNDREIFSKTVADRCRGLVQIQETNKGNCFILKKHMPIFPVRDLDILVPKQFAELVGALLK